MLVGKDPLALGLVVKFANSVHSIRAFDRLIVFDLVAEAIQKFTQQRGCWTVVWRGDHLIGFM